MDAKPPVGILLRRWRERRRLSQLELSIRAEISTRHLSFVETGRSAPSRDLVLQLTDRLDVPLRERNRLLLAAGFAPVYPETPLEDPRMDAVRAAVRQLLTSHEPYPAVVVDRAWNLVDANGSIALFTALIAPHLLAPPANVLRASLHPEGLAPHIVNLAEWRGHLLHRVHRIVELSADPGIAELAMELESYPGPVPTATATATATAAAETAPGNEIMTPLRLRRNGTELSFFSMVATFGTPLDVTLSELAIEAFYPADAATARLLTSTQDCPK